jgi:hypothetical protein
MPSVYEQRPVYSLSMDRMEITHYSKLATSQVFADGQFRCPFCALKHQGDHDEQQIKDSSIVIA